MSLLCSTMKQNSPTSSPGEQILRDVKAKPLLLEHIEAHKELLVAHLRHPTNAFEKELATFLVKHPIINFLFEGFIACGLCGLGIYLVGVIDTHYRIFPPSTLTAVTIITIGIVNLAIGTYIVHRLSKFDIVVWKRQALEIWSEPIPADVQELATKIQLAAREHGAEAKLFVEYPSSEKVLDPMLVLICNGQEYYLRAWA
jgi:hypothetical protein